MPNTLSTPGRPPRDAALDLLKWLALSSDEFDVPTVEILAAEAQLPSLESLDAALAAGVLLPNPMANADRGARTHRGTTSQYFGIRVFCMQHKVSESDSGRL